MKIPKYIIEAVSRASFEYDECTTSKNYAAGYTIRIPKASPYTYATTARVEVEKIAKWANRNVGPGTARILKTPGKTHYAYQYSIITIFDPLMQHLESYIKA